MGNTYPMDRLQGWTIPVPDDDDKSCEGSEGLNTGELNLGDAQTEISQATTAQSPKWVCLILQNLNMVVGNPSSRCYANAPRRAFCWMCAYLAEFNREAWGVIKMPYKPLWNSMTQWTSNAYQDSTFCGKSTTSTWKGMLQISFIPSGFNPKPE